MTGSTTKRPLHLHARWAGWALAAVLAVLATLLGGAGSAGAAAAAAPAPTLPTQVIPLGGTNSLPVALDQQKRVLYVAQDRGSSSELVTVDTASNQVTGTRALASGPSGIVVDPQTHLLYLSVKGDPLTGTPATVVQLDPATGATRTLTLAADLGPIALDTASRHLYLPRVDGAVSVVDIPTFTEITVIPDIGGYAAGSIVVDPTAHTALVSTVVTVVVIDTDTNTVIGQLPPGDGYSAGLAVDPTNHLAYASRFVPGAPGTAATAGTVTTYDTAARTVVRTAAVTSPFTLLDIAVDPATGVLYGTTAVQQPGGTRPGLVALDPASGDVSRVIAGDDDPSGSSGRVVVDTTSHTAYYTSQARPDDAGRRQAIVNVVGPASSCPLVIGAIGVKYTELGGCTSYLGRPTSSEQSDNLGSGGRVTHFEHGDIYWSATTGAHAITGDIEAAWLRQGGPAGRLGYPTSDEFSVLFGRATTFAHGFIYYNPLIGAVPIAF